MKTGIDSTHHCRQQVSDENRLVRRGMLSSSLCLTHRQRAFSKGRRFSHAPGRHPRRLNRSRLKRPWNSDLTERQSTAVSMNIISHVEHPDCSDNKRDALRAFSNRDLQFRFSRAHIWLDEHGMTGSSMSEPTAPNWNWNVRSISIEIYDARFR